jgi:hypothetical protein
MGSRFRHSGHYEELGKEMHRDAGEQQALEDLPAGQQDSHAQDAREQHPKQRQHRKTCHCPQLLQDGGKDEIECASGT